MKTKIIRIGNSRGIRIPKPVLEQAGLHDEVELEIEEGGLRITAAARVRNGWSEAAQLMSRRGEDGLLEMETQTDFDVAEWTW